jgi:hypothetical protein
MKTENKKLSIAHLVAIRQKKEQEVRDLRDKANQTAAEVRSLNAQIQLNLETFVGLDYE